MGNSAEGHTAREPRSRPCVWLTCCPWGSKTVLDRSTTQSRPNLWSPGLAGPSGSDSVGLREESKACILKTPQEMARDGPRAAVWACTVCASWGKRPGTPGSGDALGVVPWAASLAPALQSGTPSSTVPSCRATGNGAPKPRHQHRRVCLSNERSSAPVLTGSPCPAPSFLSMWPWSSWSQDGCRPSCPQDRGGRGSVQLERDTVPDRLPPEPLWPESLAQPISCGRG